MADSNITNGVHKKYNGTETEAIIPEGVTGIDERAFSDCKILPIVPVPQETICRDTFDDKVKNTRV